MIESKHLAWPDNKETVCGRIVSVLHILESTTTETSDVDCRACLAEATAALHAPPRIVRVDITHDAELRGWAVHPIWSGVDRPDTGGWVLSDLRVAARLREALLAGVVYTDVQIRTDVDGQTFASGTSRVMAKYANADLHRLGF